MRKDDFYKGVKTVGFITFIPFMMAAGPLAGYFVADLMQKKFNLSSRVLFLGVFFGFAVGIMETIRIIKAVARVNKK